MDDDDTQAMTIVITIYLFRQTKKNKMCVFESRMPKIATKHIAGKNLQRLVF